VVYANPLVASLFVSTLMVSGSSNRDWWRSDVGKVTEHRDEGGTTCTLLLKTDQGEFRFMWSDKLPPRAIVQRPDWNFPPNRMWNVSLRIGGTWLDSGDGTDNIPALTGSHSLMFLVRTPVGPLLNAGPDIAVRTADQTFEMNVPQHKMRKLMTALRKCTKQIAHGTGTQVSQLP
jgi:hypothetical protein